MQTNQLNEEILQLKLTIRNQNENISQLNGDIVKLREDYLTLKNQEANQRLEITKKLEEAREETNQWRNDYLMLERSKSEEILKLNEDIDCLNVQLQQSLKENEHLRVEMRCKYFHDLPVCIPLLFIYHSPSSRTHIFESKMKIWRLEVELRTVLWMEHFDYLIE